MTFKVPAAALACALSVAACGGHVTAPDRPSASVSSQHPPPPRAMSSAAAVRASWPQRAIRPEDATLQDASQVLDPAAHVLYALVPVASGSSYVLQAIDLRTGRVRRGASYRLSELALAAGYLWVYGQLHAGRPSVLDEVSPRTLATIRSLSVPGNDPAAPVAGAAGSVWAGAGRTLLRISVSTGAVLARAVLPSGLELSALAALPAGDVYASAVRLNPGGAVVLEYTAGAGRRLAQSGGGALKWSANGAWLTAVPGGVWVWFRTGMLGLSGLLSAQSLNVVAGLSTAPDAADSPATGIGTIYDWAMGSSAAYAGGVLWVTTNGGLVACVNPVTGRVRDQERVASQPILVAPDPATRQIVVIMSQGATGVVSITPPRDCWG